MSQVLPVPTSSERCIKHQPLTNSSIHDFEPWKREVRDVSFLFRQNTPLKQMTRQLATVYQNGLGPEDQYLRWTISLFLAKGAYGEVYQGQDQLKQLSVALKVNRPGQTRFQLAQREQRALHQWQSIPHVVRFYGGFSVKEAPLEKILVMELTGPNLHRLLVSQKHLSLTDTTLLVQQLLETYKASSAEELVHADLKPANLIFKNRKLKIVDFGFAHCVRNQYRPNTLQTLPYRAPEMVLGHPYDSSIDLWSIGCIAFEAYYGKEPFGNYKEDTVNDQQNTLAQIVFQIGYPSPFYLQHCSLKDRYFHFSDSGYGLRQHTLGNWRPWRDQIRRRAERSPETKEASELFIELLAGIFRYENRIGADAALQLCNRIIETLDHPLAPEPLPDEKVGEPLLPKKTDLKRPSHCAIL